MKGSLAVLAVPGALVAVKVTPGARRRFVELRDGVVHIAVNEVAEGGKATEAARVALAEALGVAKTRLVLVRGETSREKVFRVKG